MCVHAPSPRDSSARGTAMDVPIISLDELLEAPARATRAAESRLLFPRCRASADERAALLATINRSLRYPITPGAPSRAVREELRRAVAFELQNGQTDDDAQGADAQGAVEQLSAAAATRLALCDVEASIVECRAAAAQLHAGAGTPRAALAERARWLRRAADFERLAGPLRVAVHGVAAASEKGGAASTSVPSVGGSVAAASGTPARRSRSFERSGVRAAACPGATKLRPAQLCPDWVI